MRRMCGLIAAVAALVGCGRSPETSPGPTAPPTVPSELVLPAPAEPPEHICMPFENLLRLNGCPMRLV